MFTTAGWWGDFWANLAADILVALVVGIVLAQYLGIRSERQRRNELREKALELILTELRENREHVQFLKETWSKADIAVSYIRTEAWRLASENQLLQGLDTNLVDVLLKAYVELADVEKRSRMLFQWHMARGSAAKPELQKILKTMAEETRRTCEEVDRAIQALEGQSAH